MKHITRISTVLGLVIFLSAAAFSQNDAPARTPDVPFVPTTPAIVDAMLKMADVKKTDVVYDLGSGDGRIVIAAAKKYGARGVGVDINPSLVAEATENAKKQGVSDKVTFKVGDLFDFDFSEATVVTLYLLPSVNLKLRPILWEQLKPGTRVVSHAFSMGDWKPEKTEIVDGSTVYFWRIPERGTAEPKDDGNDR